MSKATTGAVMTTKQKPIRIIPGTGKHKTETRVFAREIHETYCMQPRCKFRGEHAQQGVCYTTATLNGSHDWSYVDKAIEYGDKHVIEMKQLCRPYSNRRYISHLEANAAASFTNYAFAVDELVRLRREVALLRVKVARKRAKK